MEPYAASLFAAEPRLWDLHAAAQALKPGDWLGWNDTIKLPMLALVGWYAAGQPPALGTAAAYEAVYEALLDAWELKGTGEAHDAAA